MFLCCVATCLQVAFYENILDSPHRTLNGEEADFFFVPVLDSCIITRADDAPHLGLMVCFISVKSFLSTLIFISFSCLGLSDSTITQ